MQRIKQIPFTRVFRSSKTSVLFIYIYTLFRYRRNRSHRSGNEENAFFERFSIGFAPMNMRPSGRWSGLSNDPNEFEAWYAHVRVRTEPRGALIERITQRGKDIYICKLAFFASIRINKSSRGTNALRAYLYVREIERRSIMLSTTRAALEKPNLRKILWNIHKFKRELQYI